MEQQDDESLESLQACVENFVLPQEMIIEVEGEDAGSLDIMPQHRLQDCNCGPYRGGTEHVEQCPENPRENRDPGRPQGPVGLASCTWNRRSHRKADNLQ
uniref:Zinc finger protein 180 n=1 Tax=Mus musculus TaxID=10090 RepID=A0A0N4SVM4_MOUSE